MTARTNLVLAEVAVERYKQDAKWGEQNHPDGTGDPTLIEVAAQSRRACDHAHQAGHGTWRHILWEEYSEAVACADPGKLREELVQVAAVAVAWVEAIDRRTRP